MSDGIVELEGDWKLERSAKFEGYYLNQGKQSPEQVLDHSKQSYATGYSVLERERQSSGSGCDEQFGFYDCVDRRSKIVYA